MKDQDKTRGQVIEELERAKEALKWLSATAIELIGFPPERDIQEFICTKTKELEGNQALLEAFLNQASAALERRHAERELRESAASLRSTVSSMDDLVFVLDRDGVFVEFYQPPSLPGLYLPPEAFPGRSYREVLPSHLVKLMENGERALAATGEAQQFDYPLTVGNEELWFSAKVSIRTDASGEVAGYTMVVRNITQRKRVEEALRTSEQKYHALVENLHDIVYSYRADGTVQYVSPNVEPWSGYTVEEIVDRHLIDFVHPDDKQLVLGNYEKSMLTGKEHPTAFRMIKKDGSYVHVEELGKMLTDGGEIVGATGVLRDITERKQAEDALRKSEEKFRGIAERSFDAIFTSDHEGKFTYLSSAVERIFGYTSKEMVQRHFSEFLVESEVPRVMRLFGEAIQGRYSEVMAIEIVKKDGAHAHLEVSHSLSLDDGRPVGIQGLIRDVTERKQAEDALHKEQRLMRQLLELQERERQLVSYEIHDGLAQHLFGAQMMFQGLKPRIETLPRDAQQSFARALRLLISGGKEARTLISQLRPPILDESGLLAAIDFLIAEQSDSADVKIEFRHNGPFEDLASALQTIVFRIVQEGLANACRHSQSEKVHLALARHNGMVRVEVRDWGRGFDPSKVAENRFGLKGIRERARLFGGSATIDTAPGKGTRVTVELPDVSTFLMTSGGQSKE